MSTEELLSYFYTNNTNYNVQRTFVIMSVGLIVGLIIYFTYFISCEKVAYNRKFNWSLVITSLITIVVMLMISSNIAISLGMVGALSIVRFRTAVKDSRDTVFIFWAIAEGLCVSSQNYKLTLVTVVFISVVIIVSSKIPGIFNRYLVVIKGSGEDIDIAALEQIMISRTINCRLRTANKSDLHQDYIYEVKTKGELQLIMMDDLLKVSGVDSVNYIIESGETVG